MVQMKRLPGCGSPDEGERAALASPLAAYAPLVERMARSFTRYGVDLEDLIQEGWVALLTAARRIEKGLAAAGFAAQARFAISVALRRHVLDAYGPVRVRRCRLRALEALLGREAWSATAASPQEPTPSREEELLHAELSVRRQRELERALSLLETKERAVIEALHLQEEPTELPALAHRLGLAERELRLVEARALGRMLGGADARDPDGRVLVGGRRVRLWERPRPTRKRRTQPHRVAAAEDANAQSRSEWAPQ